MQRAFVGVCIVLLFSAPRLGAQGKLARVREEVSRPADEEKENKNDCDNEESFLGQILAGLFSAATAGSDGEDGPPAPSLFFLPSPYADGGAGYLREEPADPNTLPCLRSWAGQVAIENGNDFSGLNRTGARLFLDSSSRVGLQARFDYFTEDLSGGRDNLSLGSAELTYCFLRASTVQLYAGVGGRFLADGQTHGGFNLTLGGDVYPARPVVFSFSLDVGSLGSADYFQGRGTIGVLYKGWEVYTGYDHRSIGSVSLDGLLVGLRRWF